MGFVDWFNRGLERGQRPTGQPDLLPARQSQALSFNDWVGMFNYGGNTYPYTQTSSTLGQDVEPPDPTFAGYVRSAYKSNGIVFACMVARALLFSEARFQFRQLRSGRPGDLFGTEALSPLELPWQNGTTGDLLTRAINDVDLAGNFYAVRLGDRIKRLRPDWVTIVLGSDLDPDDPGLAMDCEVLGYLYRPGGYAPAEKSQVLRPEQVAHWASLPDPEANFRGMSWITAVIREIMADQAATNHSQQFFEKGATPNYVVTVGLEGEPFQEFVQAFKQSHSDLVDAYRTLFLTTGSTISPVGATMEQAEFKETRGSGETRICMAARVPPIIVGASEGLQSATYSNYGQARRAFADLTMRPLWRQVCGALASIIDVPERSELWYDDRDIAFLQEDVKDAADITEANSRSIRTLSDGGFDPDSARDAVVSGDLRRLKHSGLLSVQMQTPGSPSPSADGKPPAELEDAPGRALLPFDPATAELERELEARAYVEQQHPRDPGGEGGGRWVKKGTSAADEGSDDDDVAPMMRELLSLNRPPTEAEIDAILAKVPLDDGPVDFGAFTLEYQTAEGTEWWDIAYADENNAAGNVLTNQWEATEDGVRSLRTAIGHRIERENSGRGFMSEGDWKGPRGQTWKDVEAHGAETAEFYGSLSRPEVGALARWTGDEYKTWNEALRDPSQMDAQERLVLHRMDRLMATAPDLEPMTVYRGATAGKGHVYASEADQGELDFTLGQMPIGSRVQLAGGGFQAATPDLERAQQFGRTIFRIKNPQRGIEASPVSYVPGEREILLDRHEFYVVTGARLETMHKGSPNEHKRVIVDVELQD